MKQYIFILLVLTLFSCKKKDIQLSQVESDEKLSISPYKGSPDSIALNIPIEIHMAFHGNKVKFFALMSFFDHHIEVMPRESYILDKRTKRIYYDDNTTEDYEARPDEDLIFYKRNLLISKKEAMALLAHTKHKDLDLSKLRDTIWLKPMKQLRADCPSCFTTIDTIDYKISFKYSRKGKPSFESTLTKINWKM